MNEAQQTKTVHIYTHCWCLITIICDANEKVNTMTGGHGGTGAFSVGIDLCDFTTIHHHIHSKISIRFCLCLSFSLRMAHIDTHTLTCSVRIVGFVEHEYWIEMGINTFRVWFTAHKSSFKLCVPSILRFIHTYNNNTTKHNRHSYNSFASNDPLSYSSLVWFDNRYTDCVRVCVGVYYEFCLQASSVLFRFNF